MARPTLTRHRKFRRLSQALRSEALARGHLEFLWESAYESGEDLVGDSDDVEASSKWRGRPGRLVAAMLDAGGQGNHGFIEWDQDRNAYVVHDLWDHAPDYVRKRREREQSRELKGDSLSASDRSVSAERRSASSQRPVSDRSYGGQCPPNGRTPAPARKEKQNPRSPQGGLDGFEIWYGAYPLKVARTAAERAWSKLNPGPELQSTLTGALGRQIQHRAEQTARSRFVPEWPHPATWLNGRRWNDQVAPTIGETAPVPQGAPFVPFDGPIITRRSEAEPYAAEHGLCWACILEARPRQTETGGQLCDEHKRLGHPAARANHPPPEDLDDFTLPGEGA